jgi:hypothetical protein
MSKEGSGLHFPTSRLVMSYYRQRPGQVINYHDAAVDLAIPENRVNAACSRIVLRYPRYGLRREGSGEYVFRPDLELTAAPLPETPEPPKSGPSGQMFEEVGQTADGTIVIRDEKGQLWKIGEVL